MPITGVVGHAAAVAQLDRALAEGTLGHATLLSGPEGVGCTTLAEAVASALLGGDRWPGGLAAHPDHWLEDSAAERISIERVRAGGKSDDGQSLQDFLSLRPFADGARVAVIGRAERLTESAANALLKTVEEPPAGVYLFLCSAYPERLPATIVSRCQTLSCRPVPLAAIRDWLTAGPVAIADDLAATVVALSGGRPGRALRLATEPGALARNVEAIDALLAIAGSGRAGALQAAARLAPPAGIEGRERAMAQLAAWTSFVRDVACLHAGAAELPVWLAYRPALERWAEALPAERLINILSGLAAATVGIAQYAAPRLTYEVLFLDLFGGDPPPPPTLDQVREPIVSGPAAVAGSRPRVKSGAKAGGRRR